jgi:hypothetical protein
LAIIEDGGKTDEPKKEESKAVDLNFSGIEDKPPTSEAPKRR